MSSSTELKSQNINSFEKLHYSNKSNNKFKNKFVVNLFSSTKNNDSWSILTSSVNTQPKEVYKTAIAITSTELVETSNELYFEIEAMFWSAKEEFFEDGIESEFSIKLNSVVEKYGSDVIEVITSLIVYNKVCSEVAGESLRWLGRIEHPESYEFRRWLLERSLTLSSGIIKDGAILGLASMDDKRSIPYLKEAIANEGSDELKQDMEQVLEQLEC